MLADSAYGKSGIRLVQVCRRGDRHALRDLTIAIKFEGDYDASYIEGDNSDVLPTDTMKNTVYAFAARGPLTDPEQFALALAEHFLDRNTKASRITIDVTEHIWRRIEVDGTDNGHSFLRHGPEKRTASIKLDRQEAQVRAGIADLLIIKSAHSAFSGFPRDEYTTLRETRDRLLATSLTAHWRYDSGVVYGDAWTTARNTLLETFATHVSESVQHTLHAMGRALLEAVPEIADVHLVMPNRHHLPVDLTPFGLENRNEVFVATEEPFGSIQATVRRP
jgi:urate oxidase